MALPPGGAAMRAAAASPARSRTMRRLILPRVTRYDRDQRLGAGPRNRCQTTGRLGQLPSAERDRPLDGAAAAADDVSGGVDEDRSELASLEGKLGLVQQLRVDRLDEAVAVRRDDDVA